MARFVDEGSAVNLGRSTADRLGGAPPRIDSSILGRLSMNEVTTYRWSFDEDLHFYRRAGYTGVGVWLRKARDFGEERAVELIADCGLAVSNVVGAGGFTGSDGLAAADSLSETRRAIALAGALRAGSLVLFTGGRNRHTRRHADRLIRSALDELLPAAEAARTPLAIEPTHPACSASWSVLTSLEQALEFVRGYDTPWLQLALDTYHFPLPESQWSVLADAAPRTAVVHLADHRRPHSIDQERCPLGAGRAQLAGIMRTLLDAGYSGFFDVELAGPDIEASDYHLLLEQSREAFRRAAEQPVGGGV